MESTGEEEGQVNKSSLVTSQSGSFLWGPPLDPGGLPPEATCWEAVGNRPAAERAERWTGLDGSLIQQGIACVFMSHLHI